MRPLRTAVAAASLVAIIAIAIASVVFVTSSSSADLIDDATALHASEAALGANDVALKALAQAVLIAEDVELGVADTATLEMAVAEAEATVASLERAVAQLDERTAETGVGAGAVAAGRLTLDWLARGQTASASAYLASDGRAAFVALRDGADGDRARAAAALSRADTLVSRTADMARFVVAFLIPLLAVVTYRFIAKRQLTVAEVQLDARLEAEQVIGRAKDEFVAGISHELRTPLTSIYGFSELLIEQGVVDPDAAVDVITLINSESMELSRMVEDLLTSARAETESLTFHIERFDAADEIAATVAPLQRVGVAVEVQCGAGRIEADHIRFRQILRNLVTNARTHGGPTIRVEGRGDGVWYEVDVSDDGPGVPTELESRLFTRFFHDSSDALVTGTVGLGLSVVRILAEAMGGTAGYVRTDGWTTFAVRLPMAPPRQEVEPIPLVEGVLVSAAEALPPPDPTWGRAAG